MNKFEFYSFYLFKYKINLLISITIYHYVMLVNVLNANISLFITLWRHKYLTDNYKMLHIF